MEKSLQVTCDTNQDQPASSSRTRMAPRTRLSSRAPGALRPSVSATYFLLLLASYTFAQGAIPTAAAPSNQITLGPSSTNRDQYYGALVGKLTERLHNVSGQVFAVDEQTLFIKNFNYDGQAPDTYFWSGLKGSTPNSDGFIVPDEKGSTKPLERYQDKDVVLRLPEGKTLREVAWLSIWSRQMRESSGDIAIGTRGQDLTVPRPLEIQPFSQLAHGLKSGPITIVDAQTFLVPDLHYDGLGPAAYFWLTRGGQGLSASGLRLKDENGSSNPLRKYSGETVVISLPDDLTIYDFDFFGVWCKEFQVNFGQTRIPQVAKVPPSPKMLGIKPENKLNCEILYDDLGYEIRWVLDGDDIVMQLVGKIEPGEYMAFGLGKDDSRSDMNNADAVVTWVDRTSGQVHAIDYFLGSKQQCQVDINGVASGSCPDVKLAGGGDSLTLLHGAIVNGYSMVTFKRPQLGVDDQYDQHVYSDGQQSVLWAIGTLNSKQEVGYHRLKTKSNMFIDFARTPQWNCPIPDLNASMHHAGGPSIGPFSAINSAASQVDSTVVNSPDTSSPSPDQGRPAPHQPARLASAAVTIPAAASQQESKHTGWFIPPIVCPQDRTFYAQIGPTAGHKGYESLTGRTGLGAAWYINGLLIPELVIERGHTYRFVIEGGNDKTSAPRRHPFYLTDSSEGGFDFKTDEERMRERLFAGVALRPDGQFVPTAEGRLCEWRQTNLTQTNPDLYQTFSAYQRSLKLDCSAGQAGVLKFTPDSSTPDSIYYQCYTHRHMGWRIKVVDSCAAYLSSLNNSVATFRASTQNVRNRQQPLARRQAEPRMGLEYNDDLAQTSRTRHHQVPFGPLASPVDLGGEDSSPSTTELTSAAEMMLANSSAPIGPQMNLSSSLDQLLKLSPADLEIIETQVNNDASDSLTLEPFIWNQSPSIPLHTFAPPDSPPPQATTATSVASFAQAEADFLLALRNMNLTQQQQAIRPQAASNSKTPKTLQAYMRRLASMYYPVQQQLASMLVTQGANVQQQPPQSSIQTQNQQQQQQSLLQLQSQQSTPQAQQPTSSETSSSFSLASLVPKSKIDLSKTGISKKWNKLRFKSGRKYEPTASASQLSSKPPTPANEFNYDIFNNQLAQLEQQQKQFQALEMASWPSPSVQQPLAQTSVSAESYNYLPLMANEGSQDSLSLQLLQQQQQQRAPMNYVGASAVPQAHQVYTPPNSLSAQQVSSNFNRQQPSYTNARLPMRFAETLLGSPAHHNQLPYTADYLSASKPNQTTSSASQPIQYQKQPQSQQVLYSAPAHAHQSKNAQQQAVFITRLPQSVNYQQTNNYQPNLAAQRHPDRTWSQVSSSGHYLAPSQSYSKSYTTDTSTDQPASGQMSTMPSVSLSTHSTSDHNALGYAHNIYEPTQRPTSTEDESMSGSGSGSHYHFRQQPTQLATADSQRQGQQTDPADHMIAIERYSKQPTERQQISIHPVTGEFVLHSLSSDPVESATSNPQPQRTITPSRELESRNISNADRYSAILVDKNLINPSSHPSTTSNPVELLELAHSMQITGGDLQRLNASNMPKGHMDTSAGIVFSDSEYVDKVQRTGAFSSNVSHQESPTSAALGSQIPSTTMSPLIFGLSSQPSLVKPIQFNQNGFPGLKPTISMKTHSSSTYPRGKEQVEQTYRSTLVDYTTTPFTLTSSSTPNLYPGQMSFDPNPFTPIEITANPYSRQQEQFQASMPRLRPPALIESMLSQHQNPFRPEPPVQVASYLAQQLGSHNTLTVASSQPTPVSVTYPSTGTPNLGSKPSDTLASLRLSMPRLHTNERHPGSSSDLIILKPSISAKQTSQTYLLKPEYLTNQYRFIGTNSLNDRDQALPGSFYSEEFNDGASSPATIRVAGHQFDRLSSLSSPPSSSMALDPMHTSNSFATTFINHMDSSTLDGKSINNRQQATSITPTAPPLTSTTTTTTTTTSPPTLTNKQPPIVVVVDSQEPQAQLKSNSTMRDDQRVDGFRQDNYPSYNKLTQHRQSIIPSSKPIPLTFETNSLAGSSILADGLRLNPGGENVNTPTRDNSTDNAILSHVMSLISSNVAPPSIPVSSYSSADYFLPISDRKHRSIRG